MPRAVAALLLLFAGNLAACTQATPASAPTAPTGVPTTEQRPQATDSPPTMTAAPVATEIPPTAVPPPTPDIRAAVASAVIATLTAVPTDTPVPTSTATPMPPLPTQTDLQLAEQRLAAWDQFLARMDADITTTQGDVDAMRAARTVERRTGTYHGEYDAAIEDGLIRYYRLLQDRATAAQSRQEAARNLEQVRSGEATPMAGPPASSGS